VTFLSDVPAVMKKIKSLNIIYISTIFYTSTCEMLVLPVDRVTPLRRAYQYGLLYRDCLLPQTAKVALKKVDNHACLPQSMQGTQL